MSKPQFKISKKVQILASRKRDGSYNYGVVVGIEGVPKNMYLGYDTVKRFFARFTEAYRYKVAYVDCITKKACVHWYNESQLSVSK